MEPNAVPQCLRCRAPLLPNALFCNNCGFPVRLAPEPVPPGIEDVPDAAPVPAEMVPATPNGMEEAEEIVPVEPGYRIGSMAYFPDTDRKYDTGPLGGYISAEAIDAPEFASDAPPFVGSDDTMPAAEREETPPVTFDTPPEILPSPEETFTPPSETFIPPPDVFVPPPEAAVVKPSPTVSIRARLLSTGDFVLIELLSWIPVVNLIVFLVWMFRRNGNLTRARAAQAKLLTFFILLLVSVIVLGVLVLLVSQGVLERLPIPSIYFR